MCAGLVKTTVFQLHAAKTLLGDAAKLLSALLQLRRRGLITATGTLAIAPGQAHVAETEAREGLLISLNRGSSHLEPRFETRRGLVEIAALADGRSRATW